MSDERAGTYREVDLGALAREDAAEGREDAFAAWGWSRLKVQRGEEILGVKVKIRSIPHDMLEALRKQAPKPPSRTVTLDPTTDEGRNRGVVSKTRALVPDFSDPAFLEQQEAHQIKVTREVVGRGVADPLMLNGVDAVTPEDRYRSLEGKGLSPTHFAQLATDILRLTEWSDDERERHFR